MNFQQQTVAFTTLLVKEIRRILRIWPQTLIPPAITMALYFIIFGKMIGSRVGVMGGVSYMQFIVPGLIMMSVITNSYSNVVGSFFTTKFHNSIEEMLVSPVSKHTILMGFVFGGVFRGLAVGAIVVALALFFTKLSLVYPLITVLSVVLTSVMFSLGGMINAIFARSFDDISIVPSFVLTPLTYLGGVFYSLENLSPFWQNLSLLNPMVYMVNTFRYGILGYSDVNVVWSLVAIGVFTAIFYTVAYRLLNDGSRLRV
ncbi:inner membrane transport permease [Moraxella macacae 0408225]|uniref:Transport permease protein n=1 Tax=Moraxella macacae 0408225 TaxID=1230338 RepID=L2F7A2_9GAMM|nr:ABC transporter permease [Moraxella macacae]ELA08912.1 inner membrane transport permease [Moraxella macacae 0408225]